MTWDPVWESIFASQSWGKYPGEDLIRFVARGFYQAPERAAVRCLEVGCGTGANLWFLAREGFAAFGIDGSPTATALARERLDAECAGWSLPPRRGAIVTGDMSRLPWTDGYFDATIDSEAVYCNGFDESRGIYREMHRVTRPGGTLFVRTFAAGSWGDGEGRALGPRQFAVGAGPLADKGPSRFTDEGDLGELLGPWTIRDVNLITRTIDHGRHTIREWIVDAVKDAGPGDSR